MPTPSLIALWHGSFDAWVEQDVIPGVESGALDPDDMVELIAALRAWETEGYGMHADSRPLALTLTGGQVDDSQEAEALREVMPEGATLLADEGYAIRDAAARKNAWANIPSIASSAFVFSA